MGRVTHADTQRMMAYLLGQRENIAKYWVTVTAGQTHTMQSLGIAAGKSAVVSWDDGLSNEYTGTATRTHVYASAGTYEVKIYTPENVTVFDLRDGAAVSVINSADLKLMANISTFYLNTLPNATITLNSADMVNWRPNSFQLYTLSNATITLNSADMVDWLPSTFNLNTLPNATITLNSADMVNWRPNSFYLRNLSNATITLNSADMVDWLPSTFYLNNLPNATVTIAPSSIKNWATLAELYLLTGNLTQPQADLVLWEVYQIVRTRATGAVRLNIAGNAAPSGTFQAATSCPVTASTPGKEIAYELLNDGCGKGFNKWTTVSTN